MRSEKKEEKKIDWNTKIEQPSNMMAIESMHDFGFYHYY